MSAVRTVPSCNITASSRYASCSRPSRNTRRPVPPHDPMTRDVNQAHDEIVLLGRDDLLAIGREEGIIGHLERLSRREIAGSGNCHTTFPAGETSTSRSLLRSAISTGPGNTDASTPGREVSRGRANRRQSLRACQRGRGRGPCNVARRAFAVRHGSARYDNRGEQRTRHDQHHDPPPQEDPLSRLHIDAPRAPRPRARLYGAVVHDCPPRCSPIPHRSTTGRGKGHSPGRCGPGTRPRSRLSTMPRTMVAAAGSVRTLHARFPTVGPICACPRLA